MREKYFLYQIFDRIAERYSPVYCATSVAACERDFNNMLSKAQHANREDFVLEILGTILDKDFEVYNG